MDFVKAIFRLTNKQGSSCCYGRRTDEASQCLVRPSPIGVLLCLPHHFQIIQTTISGEV